MAVAQPVTPQTKKKNPGRTTALLGALLLVGAVLLLTIFLSSLSSKTAIVVAARDIPAYSQLGPNDVRYEEVPTKSVTSLDITKDTFEKRLQSNVPIVTKTELIAGQRVPAPAIEAAPNGSLAAVRQGEVAIAVSTSFPGSVAGAVAPGSVVDIYGSTGGGAAGAATPLIEKAKVLAIGSNPAQTGARLRPSSSANNGDSNNEGGGNIVVVLAVDRNDAGKLAQTGQVYLSLDPHFSFKVNGEVCELGVDCESDRSSRAQ